MSELTKELLAAKLTGCEYTQEISKEMAREASEAGLVVIFGGSDDLCEIRGALYDEVGAYEGGKILLHRNGVLQEDHDSHSCNCNFCGFRLIADACSVVEAKWCTVGDWAWAYETELPHVTFEVYDNGEKYCRGIVLDLASLPVIEVE